MDDDELKKDIENILNSSGDSNDLLIKLSILKHYDFDKFMDTMYSVMAENPTKLVEASGDTAQKLKAIEAMVNHYESKEVYERCKVLVEIYDAIIERPCTDG